MLAAGLGGVVGTRARCLPCSSSWSSTARLSIAVATFLAATAGAVVSFTLNKYIAFRDRSPITLPQLARFGLVAVATALLMAIAMKLVAVKLGVPYLARQGALRRGRVRRVDLSRAAPPRVRRRVDRSLQPWLSLARRRSLAMSNLTSFVDLSIVVPAYNEEHAPAADARASARVPRRAAAALRDRRRRRRLEGRHVRRRRARDGDRSRTCASCARRRTAARAPPSARGMLAARGQIRVMCDADCSMPPEQLPRLLAPIVACNAEIAIGSRYAEGAKTDVKQPFYRVLWSRLCNKVIQRSLVPGVRDTQCGFKAFTAEAARDLFRRGRDRRLGVRPRDPRARAPPRLRDRGGRRRVEGRRPLARQSAQGHVEGDPRGADDPPQPPAGRLQHPARSAAVDRGTGSHRSLDGEVEVIAGGGAQASSREESPSFTGQGAG